MTLLGYQSGEAIDDMAKELIDEEDEDISKQLLININSS